MRRQRSEVIACHRTHRELKSGLDVSKSASRPAAWPLFRYSRALGSREDLMIRATACTFVLSALLAAATAEAGQPDLILAGAKVLTADPRQPTAEAIALEGERIRGVGRTEDVRRLAGPQTRIVDLRGRTVIPGLIDAHVHLLIAPAIVDEPSLRNYERTVLPTVMRGFISHGITTVRSTGDP